MVMTSSIITRYHNQSIGTGSRRQVNPSLMIISSTRDLDPDFGRSRFSPIAKPGRSIQMIYPIRTISRIGFDKTYLKNTQTVIQDAFSTRFPSSRLYDQRNSRNWIYSDVRCKGYSDRKKNSGASTSNLPRRPTPLLPTYISNLSAHSLSSERDFARFDNQSDSRQ